MAFWGLFNKNKERARLGPNRWFIAAITRAITGNTRYNYDESGKYSGNLSNIVDFTRHEGRSKGFSVYLKQITSLSS